MDWENATFIGTKIMDGGLADAGRKELDWELQLLQNQLHAQRSRKTDLEGQIKDHREFIESIKGLIILQVGVVLSFSPCLKFTDLSLS